MRSLTVFLLAGLVMAGCGEGNSGSDGGGGTNTAQSECNVRFALSAGQLTGDLQAIVDYRRASGHFVGVNTAVECVRLDSRAAVTGANQCTGPDGECRNHDRPELYIVAQTTRPLSAPLALLDCHFVGSKTPAFDDFELAETFATDADGATVEPPPTVVVTDITCTGPTTTTTTLPLPDPCVDVDCPSGESCVDGDCVATNRYVVEFQTDVAASYASLQVDLHYDCNGGRFDGLGDKVACRTAPEINAFAAFNHVPCIADDGDAYVTAGLISLLSWPGPGPFISCDYTSATGEPPTPDSFRVDVVEATTIDDEPIRNATASVSRIRPIVP